jgi:hypothetical protein
LKPNIDRLRRNQETTLIDIELEVSFLDLHGSNGAVVGKGNWEQLNQKYEDKRESVSQRYAPSLADR